jgi:hypothetical protein
MISYFKEELNVSNAKMPIEQQSALRKISSYCGLSERAIKLHDMIKTLYVLPSG